MQQKKSKRNFQQINKSNRLNITRNIILASAALLLALLAAFTGSSSENSAFRYIYPEQLADSIISKSAGLLLIDLRSEKDYSGYHIFNSVHPDEQEAIESKGNNYTVIISDNIRKVRSLIGKNNIINYYLLYGGMDSWRDKILFPHLSKDLKVNSPEVYKKKERVSRYFGGQPVYQDAAETKKSYRREGC